MNSRVIATYRIQLRNGFGLDDAAAVVPYVAELGASHIYLSPIWRASPGSTHGYDVCDHNEIDPVIGGRAAFDRLSAQCRAASLGIVLDIVPNHMAASPANAWWADVLAWGRASRFSEHFDIDWSAEKLLLPVLGAPYAKALEARDFRVARAGNRLVLEVYDRQLPLSPPSWAIVLAAGPASLTDLELALAASKPDCDDRVAALLAEAAPQAVAAALAAVNDDTSALHRLHEAQPWRLAHWRMARDALTYRRFFEVADLVGVKVERSKVFDDVHRLTLDLVRSSAVNGLRVDHVDGLADPATYLKRLREAAGTSVPIWVEKILHEGEAQKPNWPVQGTTGYEFAQDMALLATDPAGETAMDAALRATVGAQPDYDDLVQGAKRFAISHNLASELQALTTMAVELAQRRLPSRDIGRDTLRRSIIEVIRKLPHYRTYVSAAGVDDEDRALILGAVAAAKTTREIENEFGVEFIGDLLLLAFEDPEDRAAALAFATRFQQISGPVTAKAVEDTVFYRFNRLIGLNEVGGAPSRFGADTEEVHAAIAVRAKAVPETLNAATTHDTKRGEDARARLYALSLASDRWGIAVSNLLPTLRPIWEGEADPHFEWLFLQTLLGVWPAGPAAPSSDLACRLGRALIKAAREAKVLTSWTQVDATYEARITAFIESALDPVTGTAFIAAFREAASPFITAGEVLGLSLHALRLLAPGAPDIYQGSEAGDFSLVDPDNRRPVDFAALTCPPPGYGARKLELTRQLLKLRAEQPALFAEGDYMPLTIDVPNVAFGFCRIAASDGIGVVVPIRNGVVPLASRSSARQLLRVHLDSDRAFAAATHLREGRSLPISSGSLELRLEPEPRVFSFSME